MSLGRLYFFAPSGAVSAKPRSLAAEDALHPDRRFWPWIALMAFHFAQQAFAVALLGLLAINTMSRGSCRRAKAPVGAPKA